MKGISAWSYSQSNEQVFPIIASYNARVPAEWRFNYYFPYAGSLEVDNPPPGANTNTA